MVKIDFNFRKGKNKKFTLDLFGKRKKKDPEEERDKEAKDNEEAIEKEASNTSEFDPENPSWKAFFPFTKEGKAMRAKGKREKVRKKSKSGSGEKVKKKRFSFEKQARRAGYDDADDRVLRKKVFKVAVVIHFLVTLLIIAFAISSEQLAGGFFIFILFFWTIGFAVMLGIVSFFFLLYLSLRAYKRTKQVEEVLPDFLQLASANVSAGMPIDRALWFAVRPNFGILANEIEDVAKATYAGKDLKDELIAFGEKYDSVVLKRAVSLILEGMAAGGEMAELLNKIALNIEESTILKKEMAANVTTYVIFIGVATLFGAPFLFALATQLLSIIQSITANVDISSTSTGFMSFSLKSDAISLSDFKIYSVVLLMISSFFSGSIISVIRKGNIKEGAILIPSLMVSTTIIYFIATLILGVLMGSFI